jgi:hypothetical protein
VISFGVIKGLIYRVHKYPILASTNENETHLNFPTRNQYHLVVNRYTGQTIHPDIIPYLDGKHHYDEICTDLECSPQELDEQLGCTQEQQSDEPQPNGNATNNEAAGGAADAVTSGNHPVGTLYEGIMEDNKQNEDQPQWNVQFIFR